MVSLLSEKPRLAIIGTGGIAEFHVSAARAVGFQVTHVAGSSDSQTVKGFAEKCAIPNIWQSSFELVSKSSEWDALVLAQSTDVMVKLLGLAVDAGKPVLAEKPLATRSDDLDDFDLDNPLVQVGFNRRFYDSVAAAKDFIESGGPCFIHLEVPESVPFDSTTGEVNFGPVRLNSVHAFDLLNYLCPNLSVKHHTAQYEDGIKLGGTIVLSAPDGSSCSILANWNIPANFAMTIDREGERFELRPFEIGTLYAGMSVVEPSNDVPIRRYLPTVAQRILPSGEDSTYKPGFFKQAECFYGLMNGNKQETAASIRDAKNALLIAELLINN